MYSRIVVKGMYVRGAGVWRGVRLRGVNESYIPDDVIGSFMSARDGVGVR